ncbi:MAG: hypothetical protein ACYDDF_12745 [Thermoplasmatota archaeon]
MPIAIPVPSARVAALGMVINAVVPGLGSLVCGRAVGWVQGAFAALGIAVLEPATARVLTGSTAPAIGFPLVLIAWPWAMGTTFRALRRAGAARTSVALPPRGRPEAASESLHPPPL